MPIRRGQAPSIPVESRNIIAPAVFLSAQFKLATAGKEIFQ